MSDAPMITVMPMTVKLLPRNEMVILKIHTIDKVKNLYMPEKSNESKKLTVYAVGPKVEGLKEGDMVMLTGKRGEDFSPIPNHPDLVVTREGNVVLVIEPLEDRPVEEKSVTFLKDCPPQDAYEAIHE